jgi:phosphoglucosamine mutase
LQRKRLSGPVVGTLMTNLGVENALRRAGVDFLRANVGDRNVLEKMQQHGANLGGESSGHIICLDRCTTGDGTVAALQVLAEMSRTGQSLRDLLDGVEKYPQEMINVRLPQSMKAHDIMRMPVLQAALQRIEAELGESGRVLLRPSGTEPLIRVMAEGREADQIRAVVTQLADTVKLLIEEIS